MGIRVLPQTATRPNLYILEGLLAPSRARSMGGNIACAYVVFSYAFYAAGVAWNIELGNWLD